MILFFAEWKFIFITLAWVGNIKTFSLSSSISFCNSRSCIVNAAFHRHHILYQVSSFCFKYEMMKNKSKTSNKFPLSITHKGKILIAFNSMLACFELFDNLITYCELKRITWLLIAEEIFDFTFNPINTFVIILAYESSVRGASRRRSRAKLFNETIQNIK
jgi:hypothetical protein